MPEATDDVNDAANKFNAEQYANDVAQAGVQYVVFTAWHRNIHPLWPSPTWRNGHVGIAVPPAIVSDMIDAVKAKGIRVFLYTHPYQPVPSWTS